jgi:hypothetical protein
MKKILSLLIVLVLLMALFGCGGPAVTEPTPKPEPTAKPTPPPPPPPQIIEHRNTDFGGGIPDWVEMTAIELEKLPEYENYYVLIEDHTGKSREGVEMWAKKFSAMSALAALIQNKVRDKFVGAAAGDKDFIETYMEEVVKSVSEGEFAGFREQDKFWVRKRYFDQDGNIDHEEFRYLFLLTVPKKEIADAVKRAFDGVKPDTEEEVSAKERVLDAWGDGFDD